ncbi:MAG: hypothetical protein KAJ31_06775 [Deltaproteobacteria bacterium]|nr:hypothetical protein [Deltaproteobacteria bacterium]MCK5709237.1 hypothetical protein [Deltaproteobacteria bacterium]
MQFLITQIHDPQDCPKDIGGFRKVLINENMDGLTLNNVFIEHGSHTIIYIVETDNYDKVIKFLEPGMLKCTSSISPVSSLSVGEILKK